MEEEVERMISVLRLEDKRDTAAKGLSRGMKRKLCVGIALIAGSTVSIVSFNSFTSVFIMTKEYLIDRREL